MSTFLPYIVAGLAIGSIYGLAGTGLVITYKTSGIFNFAYPAMAAIAAYSFYLLHEDTVYFNVRLPWPVAAAIAVLVIGPLMGLGMEVLARGLANVATSLQIVATVGLSLGIIGFLGLFYLHNSGLTFNPFLPQSTFDFLGTNVGWDQLTLFLFGAIAVAALYFYFRLSRMGMAMRAVVDNPDLMSLTGTSSTVVRRRAWIIGGTFVAASGVLLAPTVNTLSAGLFFAFVISAFGAAALGVFRSLPLTFGGGLLIGILGSLASKYETSISWLQGADAALPFVVLFIVLIVVKPSKLRDTRVLKPRPPAASYYAPWLPRLSLALPVLVLLALIPNLLPDDLAIWSSGLLYVILAMSLGLLIKESGQVSLAQSIFAAVGGVAFAHSAAQWGFPWLLAILFAGVVTAAVGLLVAVPAIRVSGVFLALATLGFAYAVYNLLYPTSIMFTTSNNGLPNLPRPSFANTDKSYYYLLLIATLLTALVMLSIRFGRLGRLLRGLADSPLALNTMGTSVNATRLIVFSISAFFAGLAGALYGSAFQAIGLQTPIFQPLTGIQLFVIVALIPGGMPWYALEGGLGLEVLPYYIQKWWPSLNVTAWVSLVLGVSAVGVALQADRPAVVVPAALKNLCERFRRVRTFAGTASARPRPAGDALEVADLNVRFGGVAAVVNLSLKAPFGQITGLIGPNGAGKTTTFNACSGLVRPPRALVKYADREINGLSPSMRARRGIGRTFQQAELWDNLTVRENVALGWEAPVAGRSPAAQLVATRDQRRQMELAAQEAMDTAGVADLSGRRVRDLSTGQRRLVELARVLAGPFDLLLLDEPSSGLDKGETERFGLVLQKVVRDRGTGILLVEHDMHLVMAVCQYIYVMDFGQKIFEGRPADVASSDIVRAAYLGSEGGEVQPLTGGTSGDGPAVEGPVGEGQEARR